MSESMDYAEEENKLENKKQCAYLKQMSFFQKNIPVTKQARRNVALKYGHILRYFGFL